jgi:hypothetical protein
MMTNGAGWVQNSGQYGSGRSTGGSLCKVTGGKGSLAPKAVIFGVVFTVCN